MCLLCVVFVSFVASGELRAAAAGERWASALLGVAGICCARGLVGHWAAAADRSRADHVAGGIAIATH